MSKFVLQQSTVVISHFKYLTPCASALYNHWLLQNNPTRQGSIFILVFRMGGEWCHNQTGFFGFSDLIPTGCLSLKMRQCEELGIYFIPWRQFTTSFPLSPSHPLKMGLRQSLQLSSPLWLWIMPIAPKAILCNVSLTWKQQWGGSPKGCLQPRGNRPWWQGRSMLLSCREVAGLFCHLLWFHFDHKELGTITCGKKKKRQNGNEPYVKKRLNNYKGLPAKAISSK